jgi:hypothetical protein
MIIATSEKAVDLRWVCEETSLILLDEHPDKENITVQDITGRVLFVVSFGALKVLREVKHGKRIQPIALSEFVIAAQDARGVGPG